MKKETIIITQSEGKVQFLSEILPDGKIPANRILRKRITGIGATYGELTATRNSIIIEPTVPVIKGKIKEHKNVLGVYEGVKVEEIIKYLSKKKKYYKFITTPESFYKIKDAIEELEINMYSDFFLLFDECEHIVQDTAYRPDITLPLDDFFLFEKKAMVSATPIIPSDPRFEEQGFKILEITPDFPILRELLLITTNCILNVFKSLVEQCNNKICVFFNSTDTIHSIIKQMKIENQSAVFCSRKSVSKLKSRGFIATYEDWEEKKMKKINFFTCRFYSAIDIKIADRPDVFMITDLNYAEHSIIDPNTEAIQIPGRFRNGISSFTHITNNSDRYKTTTREELKGYLNGSEEIYNRIKLVYDYAVSKELEEAFGNVLETIPYASLLNSDGSKNFFAMDNFINEKIVKSYYKHGNSILEAYQGTDMFETTYKFAYLPLGDIDKLKRERNMSIKEQHREIVRQLELLKEYETESVQVYIDELKNTDPFIVNAYHNLGRKQIEALNYSRPKIEEAIILKKYKEKISGLEFFELLNIHFKAGNKYTTRYIINKLKHIFKVLEATPKKAITSELICDFFTATPYRSGNEKGYYLLNRK